MDTRRPIDGSPRRGAQGGMKPASAALGTFSQLGERLASGAPADLALAGMMEALEGEILPRLMLTFSEAAPGAALNDGDRDDFLDLVLSASAHEMAEFISALSARGVPQTELLADLMTDAARRLGVLWEEDRCDFSDVALGLCRLHDVLRDLSVRGTAAHARRAVDGPRILLSSAPGDPHVFGLMMVAEFFRRDGWHVLSEPAARASVLLDLVANERIDVVGLSIGAEDTEKDLAFTIRALRKASSRPDLTVFVGGYALLDNPELAERIGADGHGQNAELAPQLCRELLAERTHA
ncbi:MAG: cobalamin B12-binding domain-containing protein [Pseudomonadota bacterium]